MSVSYRFYRFRPTALRSATDVQMTSLRVYNGGTLLSAPSASGYGDNTSYPGSAAGENVAQLRSQGGPEKWFSSDGTSDFVVMDMGSATTIDEYRWETGNDQDGRDPTSWVFEGSNDTALASDPAASVTWTALDTVTSYAVTTDRQTFVDDNGSGGFDIAALGPDTPTAVSLTADATLREIDGSWTAATGADSYDVQVDWDNAGAWSSLTTFNQAGVTFTLDDTDGVDWATDYRMRVRTVDGAETSAWSSYETATTVSAPTSTLYFLKQDGVGGWEDAGNYLLRPDGAGGWTSS